MRIQHNATVVAFALTCAVLFGSGCLQSPTIPPETDEADSPSLGQGSEQGRRAEPIGDAEQHVLRGPVFYGSKDFPFVAWIPDDGKDPAGGWQRSVGSLSFVVTVGIRIVYEWSCPIQVEMPVRSEVLGVITPSRASLWAAQAANIVVPLLLESRDDWTGLGAVFCNELYVRMRSKLNGEHSGLGARVRRP